MKAKKDAPTFTVSHNERKAQQARNSAATIQGIITGRASRTFVADALPRAAKSGDLELLKAMVQSGHGVNEVNHRPMAGVPSLKSTPIMFAAQAGHREALASKIATWFHRELRFVNTFSLQQSHYNACRRS